jgi:predicted thioesterase
MVTAVHAALEPGLTTETGFEVTAQMVPGHVAAPVISTPAMIGLIETACRRCILPYLDEGHDSVGVHVCVSHEGVAYVGEEIVVNAELTEIANRRLTFETHVRAPRGVISRGTHRRVIVDPRTFGPH